MNTNPTAPTPPAEAIKQDAGGATDTPRYDALLIAMEKVPRIEGDRMLREFARQMEQTYMDSRFDDITKAGSIAIWEAVQKLSPWSESNDMPWEDEILCGLTLALRDKDELSAQLAATRKELEELRQQWNAREPQLYAAERELEEARKAVEDEPELPGDMPDEMWAAINGNREATVIALRETVRETKRGILERLSDSARERVSREAQIDEALLQHFANHHEEEYNTMLAKIESALPAPPRSDMKQGDIMVIDGDYDKDHPRPIPCRGDGSLTSDNAAPQ